MIPHTHTTIVGASGSGKTVTAKHRVEKLLQAGEHVCVVDPTGAWYGLRSNAAGDGPGFDIPLFGGRRGDAPLAPQHGRILADAIGRDGISAIIDLSGFRTGFEQRQFMADFIAGLRAKPRGTFHLVIDEADEFAPQTVADGIGQRLLEDLIWVAKRGRVDGFVAMFITQRPADISKAVLSQMQTLIIHQLLAPQDRTAVKGWVDGHADKAKALEVMSSLAGLSVGQRWLLSPRADVLELGHTPALTTFDSSASPKAGEKVADPVMADASAAIERVLGLVLADAGKPADLLPAAGDDSADLRQKLAEIKADRDIWEQRALQANQINAQYSRAVKRLQTLINITLGDISWPHVQRADMSFPTEPIVLDPVVLPDEIAEIPAQGGGGPGREAGQTEAVATVPPQPRATAPASAPEKAGGGNASPAAPDSISRGAHKLIEAVAKCHPRPITERQAATIAGVSLKSSAWRNNRADALKSGLLEWVGARWALSQAGIAAHGQTKPITLAQMQSMLPPSAARMLGALADAKSGLTKAEIADQAGISPTSSGLGSGIRELVSAGFVEERGGVYHIAKGIV